jgi:hypothetical protein
MPCSGPAASIVLLVLTMNGPSVVHGFVLPLGPEAHTQSCDHFAAMIWLPKRR